MKILTLKQLKSWKPCGEWAKQFESTFGKEAKMFDVEKALLKEKKFSELNWLIGKRLEQLNRRQICAFAYRCAYRSLKYARRQDLEVLKKAIAFAKEYADKGKVDEFAWSAAESAAESAARSARSARSAESAARSAWSAAWSAARSAAESAESAAWSAAWSARSARSAESAARSAWSAARSAARSAAESAESAEYKWQLKQLAEIEKK